MKADKTLLDAILKKAAEYAAESIIITKLDGRILYVNPAFVRMTGFTLRQVLGKQPNLWSSKSHPNSFYKNMWDTILAGKTWTGEVLNKKKNGTNYSAILAIGPVLGKAKKPIAFIAVHTDISKMKKLELALAKANKKLRTLSVLDALTGLYNRRYFNESIVKEWRDSLRNKNPITAIMIDVDHFKKYNDHYGHLTGDKCLKKLANSFNACLNRPRDIVARYGGEEFIVLLPNTPAEGGLKIANSIIASIRKLKIPHEASTSGKIVSLSLGVITTVPSHSNSWEEFIEQADQLLYQSKQNGRDQLSFKDWN